MRYYTVTFPGGTKQHVKAAKARAALCGAHLGYRALRWTQAKDDSIGCISCLRLLIKERAK
jgi:hypothetical protein